MSPAPRSERPNMPGYGVTDDPTGLLPWEWAEQKLVATRNYWLITADTAGRPHSMPVWGVWMPDSQRWGLGCASTARKTRNMRTNGRVVVTNEDTVECVSVEGRAVEVSGAHADALIETWVEKYHDGTWPRNEMAEFLRAGTTFEVIPERAFGLIERPEEFSTAATRWVWD